MYEALDTQVPEHEDAVPGWFHQALLTLALLLLRQRTGRGLATYYPVRWQERQANFQKASELDQLDLRSSSHWRL